MSRWFCSLACLSFLAAGFVFTAPVQAEVKVGEAAPDFELVGSDGKTYKLSDFKGKQAVVVDWFPKAFTGGCTKECKSFKEQGAELKKFDVAYFTASCDTADLNKKFAESLGLDYPILSDPDAKTAVAYGLTTAEAKKAARVTFVITADGKIGHIDRAVKTEQHGADIAKVLGELGVKKK